MGLEHVEGTGRIFYLFDNKTDVIISEKKQQCVVFRIVIIVTFAASF